MMYSKSFPKGILLSSTPVQTPEDSGYFGSGQRKNFYGSTVLSSYSPIKELSFKNLSESFPLEHDFDEISPDTKSDNKILDYENFSKSLWEPSSIEITEFSSYNEISPKHKSSEKFHNLSSCISENTENKNYSFNSLSENKNFEQSYFKDKNKSKSLKKELVFHFSVPDVKYDLQGLTLKRVKLDFIHQLKEMNCLSIISCILSYLSAKELCTVSCVNKEWNQLIQSDRHAKLRKETLLKQRYLFFNGPSKENRLGMRLDLASEHKNAFCDITNYKTSLHPLNPEVSNTKFDSFMKERKNGQSKLLKCPKCLYASKCLHGNCFMCTHCYHTFCSICLDPILKNHTCSKQNHTCLLPQLPNLIIGSKKSKKNLKRL